MKIPISIIRRKEGSIHSTSSFFDAKMKKSNTGCANPTYKPNPSRDVINAVNAPNTTNKRITQIKEITKPAIASPLGSLNMPTEDRTNPKTHKIQPNTGIQPKKMAINANTNPAVPIPLDCCCGI